MKKVFPFSAISASRPQVERTLALYSILEVNIESPI
jgi:hypothetical protein